MAASDRPPHEPVRQQFDHVKKTAPDQAAELDKDGKLDDPLARMKAGTARDDENLPGASVYDWKSMAARPSRAGRTRPCTTTRTSTTASRRAKAWRRPPSTPGRRTSTSA